MKPPKTKFGYGSAGVTPDSRKMHEDNHAEIVSISASFSHKQATNSISISCGLSDSEHPWMD
jgi:hypothetical protein